MESFLDSEVLGITTGREVVLLVHLFGLALGAGAAFFSDFLFTHIIKDKRIDDKEYSLLRLASSVVWLGLSVLFISGLLIFIGDTERLLDASKFLAKMTIVFILLVNGIYFHFSHIPKLRKVVGKKLDRRVFKKKQSRLFFMSGAVSGVSWAAALVLGGLSSLSLSYLQIMGLYVAVLLPAVLFSLVLEKLFFRR